MNTEFRVRDSENEGIAGVIAVLEVHAEEVLGMSHADATAYGDRQTALVSNVVVEGGYVRFRVPEGFTEPFEKALDWMQGVSYTVSEIA